MKRLVIIIQYFITAAIAVGMFASEVHSERTVSVTGESPYPLIIIDAGHGGQDGGAVSDDGTEEQYINLDIALKMRNILSVCGFETLLTRQDDNSIHDKNAHSIREKKVSDIHNRLKIIESHPGCIFVSIHQNFYMESKYWGTQVFFSGNNEKSSTLAEYIQSNVISQLQPDNTRKIKQSGKSIYILYYATEPAVLIECGFLSNAEETKKLNDENYRLQMSMSVSGGLIKYINDCC